MEQPPPSSQSEKKRRKNKEKKDKKDKKKDKKRKSLDAGVVGGLPKVAVAEVIKCDSADKGDDASDSPDRRNSSNVGSKRPRPTSPDVGDVAEPVSSSGTAAASTTSIRVSVSKSDLTVDPVIVSFPRGVPSSILKSETKTRGYNDDAPAPLRFTYSKLNPKSSRGRKVTASTENDNHGGGSGCRYEASTAGRGYDNRLTKRYVVVFDKVEKTFRVVPTAERGTVFALEQTVLDYEPEVSKNAEADGAANKLTAAERKTLLFEAFGSRKKQKVLASQAANVVNVNSVVGKGTGMMASVAGQGEIISEGNRKAMSDAQSMVDPVEAALMEARRSFLPPFDESAESAHKVYIAQNIAGAAWNQCSRIVDKRLKEHEEGGENWIDGLLGVDKVSESMKALMDSIDVSQKGAGYRIKTAFFLSLTLRFHMNMHRKGGSIPGESLEACIKFCGVPLDVGERLFELFTVPSEGERPGYMASKQLTDKRLVHILILYAIASGKDLIAPSINQLCKDMFLDTKKASQLLKEGGFVIKNMTGGMGISLPIPLKFPPPRRMQKK